MRTKAIRRAVLTAAALLCAAPLAPQPARAAQDGASAGWTPVEGVSLHHAPGKGAAPFVFAGHYRLRVVHLRDFEVDELGRLQGQTDWVEHRLRLRPEANLGKGWRIVLEADVVDGIVGGDRNALGLLAAERTGADFLDGWRARAGGRTTDSARLRQLYVEWLSPIGLWRVGQMTSAWGLGVLAASGSGEEPDFADNRYGDLVERVLWMTKPLKFFGVKGTAADRLYLALGADLVVRDENADLWRGDRAWEAVAALGWRAPAWTVGVYVARRKQRDANGDRLEATAVDLYGRSEWKLGSSLTVWAAAEAVGLAGTTDRVRLDQAPQGVDLLAYGGALIGGVRAPALHLDATLELGAASGDRDPNDGTVRTFTFDPEHHVGMILFEDVLARMTLRSADRVSDPELAAEPPQGAQAIPTNGSIQNALYVNPVVRWKPGWGLSAKLGFLWARAAAPWSDPFNAAQHGGYATGFRGAPDPGPNLGYEVDGAVAWAHDVNHWFGFRLGVQVGYFVPGDAFDDAQGGRMDPVTKVRVLADLTW